jgi:voltage-gated potassium channel
MEFTLLFVKLFFFGLQLTAPILLFLALIILLLGQYVGRRESWSRFEALYWSLVTATTVGYGDYRPLDTASRMLSILIAICGVIFTGIIVAIAVTSTTKALEARHDPAVTGQIIEKLDQ